MTSTSAANTPADLPVPLDDGACSHLVGMKLPSISLPLTSGESVDLSTESGLVILFCYPRTGAPGESIPASWDSIPGARGCTPQACSFRDASDDLAKHGVDKVYGLSTQSTEYQKEARNRLRLPYHLVSDDELRFAKAMSIPTFTYEGNTLVKRVTLAARDGEIVKVWYPVFPTHESANEVLKWLKSKQV